MSCSHSSYLSDLQTTVHNTPLIQTEATPHPFKWLFPFGKIKNVKIKNACFYFTGRSDSAPRSRRSPHSSRSSANQSKFNGPFLVLSKIQLRAAFSWPGGELSLHPLNAILARDIASSVCTCFECVKLII